ncbi:hypothetical protein HPB48_018026 [Haemaphysalis longicornis]|uniref:Uncharacterized protein n=1 Tax=Haemaphysalis longicornis TaxID=44386 RepID=A0A9J6F859_HAELO|nr:hypothetical protein HPB48_018026 [Haemaphysalis longicornis]
MKQLKCCRDVNERGIVIVSSSAFKEFPELTPSQLAQMLMYFYTIPKIRIVGISSLDFYFMP